MRFDRVRREGLRPLFSTTKDTTSMFQGYVDARVELAKSLARDLLRQ